MGTLYLGTKAIYTDDKTGFYWDSPLKRERLNADGSKYVEEIEEAITSTVTVEPTPITETTIESVSEEFKCDICGYPAKSKAGLAAHKRSH